MNKIKFIDTSSENKIPKEYYPTPAKKYLPEWYKKTNSSINNVGKKPVFGETPLTIKKCIPVFDYLTAGYIIPTYCDIYVEQNGGDPVYHWPIGDPIEWHTNEQAPIHPYSTGNPYPKWISPWSIITPKGYSTLLVPPGHGSNEYFTILEGFVDTDVYNVPINFVFKLNDPDFEGMIPAGTPMAQVIPIKRERWSHELEDKTSKKIIDQMVNLRSTWFDGYRNRFWNRKSFD